MSRTTTLGWALVAVQGVLFVLVVAAAFNQGVGPQLWSSLPLGLALVVLGGAGMLWAGRDLGSALTPLPNPNGRGMAAKGLYRRMRHPMYTSIILVCLGVAISAGNVQTYAVVLVLAGFFEFKTRLEERYLVDAYEGYAAYAARTGKFLPRLGERSA